MDSVRNALTDMRESSSALSTLGRVQMILLLGNSLLTLIFLNAAGSYGSSKGSHRVDQITLAISLTFTIGSIAGFLYTIRVESAYAFIALCVLQVEQAAFVTAAAAGNVITSPWAKWLVVSTNILSIVIFLLLQLFVRQSWGWHAYKAIGGNTESIKMYQRYQKLAGIMYLDLIHIIFFIIAEEVVVKSSKPSQWALVYGATIPCLVLGGVMLRTVRNDLRIASLTIYLIYAAAFGVYVYYTILNTVGTITNDLSNLDHHVDFTSREQAVIVITMEWCAVCARMTFLVVAIRVATTSGFKHLLGSDKEGGGHESRYLISADEAQRERANTISTLNNHHVRQVAVIDSSHQTRSAIPSNSSRQQHF